MKSIKIANGLGKLKARHYPLLLPLLCISCSRVDYEVFVGNRHTSVASQSGNLGRAANGNSRGTYKVGKPYRIFGKEYYPEENKSYTEVGVASWYGEECHNRRTANGDIFNMNSMTAAHRTLPMPSVVNVVNLENGKSTVLVVNDRGPFADERIIDVSKRAAQELGFMERGTTRVKVQFMERETKELLKSMGLL
jgi:rare lipoprotein A